MICYASSVSGGMYLTSLRHLCLNFLMKSEYRFRTLASPASLSHFSPAEEASHATKSLAPGLLAMASDKACKWKLLHV